MSQSSFTSGAQSLRRSLQLLRLLATRQADGLRLNEVMELTGLEKSTAHRLLSCLVEENFAEKDNETKRYRLGIDAMQVGSAAGRRMPLMARFRPMMMRLGRISGETVYLMARDGDDVVCLHREEGSHPIKVFAINTGDRRKIGVGAGGMALLATLEDDEINELHSRYQSVYEAIGLDRKSLWRHVRTTRQLGYHRMVNRTAPGVAGIGVVVPSTSSVRFAISLGTVTPLLTEARGVELGELLKSTVREIGNS